MTCLQPLTRSSPPSLAASVPSIAPSPLPFTSLPFPCSVSHVLSGDRGTEVKVALRSPLLFAHTFHVDGAPGLMAIHAGEEEQGPVLEVRGPRGRPPSLGLLLR